MEMLRFLLKRFASSSVNRTGWIAADVAMYEEKASAGVSGRAAKIGLMLSCSRGT